jgi:hypothetical protein
MWRRRPRRRLNRRGRRFHTKTFPRQRPRLPEPPALPIRIYFVPWLIPAWARAQAWWTVILVKRGVGLTERLLAHELAHVLQWRSLGVWGFLCRYARFFLRHGYEAHPLEMAARRAETDEFFLNWARKILQSRKKPETVSAL